MLYKKVLNRDRVLSLVSRRVKDPARSFQLWAKVEGTAQHLAALLAAVPGAAAQAAIGGVDAEDPVLQAAAAVEAAEAARGVAAAPKVGPRGHLPMGNPRI
mmetsp:Transcript_23615/g.45889  ORF Transcript_23615/g.45889 Transcript_23615/m.45889 type:complete len:101 (+) Transcript_23615:358-660(+)